MTGVYKLTFGEPESITPTKYKEISKIELSDATKFNIGSINFKKTLRGCRLEIPLEFDEEVYGFGLQLNGFNHKGSKKMMRPNADPVSNSGDSHAPVPFYCTNKYYGIYVDTARYAEFYCGYGKNKNRPAVPNNTVITNAEELYKKTGYTEKTVMVIDIPVAKGVDIYIFEGESITDVVAKYNMFSGGGCMPPLWGLGVSYRCNAKYTDNQVIKMADYFRERKMPCDIIGLEPGWQSSSYSCSYVWDNERYPNYKELIRYLRNSNFNINLWEHAFVNSISPLYQKLHDFSGTYEVWKGITTDFAGETARDIFSEYHKNKFVDEGITGFKLDECDGSDFTGGWSFPNCDEFPSGVDGEQMHSLFGILYQKTILKALGNQRTFSEVRNSGAFAAPYPFVLYSDLYDHKVFIRGLATAGFSGLLWVPELRRAKNKKDLLRRLQTVVFSPRVIINAWNTEEAPWIKLGAGDEVRELLELRMSLVPYVYSAFYRYHKHGVPPIRALVSDYSDDENTYNIDDEYMFGDSMLVAPMTVDEDKRMVYLPGDAWYDFWTDKKYERGWHEVQTDNIPVYIKKDSVIPLAEPMQYISKDTVFQITLKCYGDKGKTVLVEDDGETHATRYKEIEIDFNGFREETQRYELKRIQCCV
ncbi:TIM-barrel domain-containing protein [Mahella australiensis]|uniref:Glycoside hydrolase family 31 n=1 Tax=Mahella australiensis (strain DSM 15567 / CIP 107919 / 50-1 BON) TaxID=697281 RepID=F3ZYP5_MAHA5|nr:TIM-barrel domain-containing protein [Mahella australiensis]AEE97813.1 glycoside hydrolase family 31 [Mahella australiensis 50-1 BON]